MFIKVQSSRLSSRSRRVIKKDLVVRGWIVSLLTCEGKKSFESEEKSSSKERTESRDKNKKKQGEDNKVWFCEECEL